MGIGGNKRYFSYKDFTYDEDHWADASKFLPADFDLCLLKTDTRTYYGWFTGKGWDGKKYQSNDRIKYWKLASKK